MCYYPLCGSIQFLQGFPMRCKNLIYDSTLKPPSLLRFWLNIIWCDTSILKNRVSVSYNGLLLATLAARSLQIVQGVPHFYFYVSLVNVRVQFDIPCYILSQTKVTRSDPKKSLHLLEVPNVLLWASRNEYFITYYYYGWNFDFGHLSMRWKYVIPHSRQIQYYTATVRFKHDYFDQYQNLSGNRKAYFCLIVFINCTDCY